MIPSEDSLQKKSSKAERILQSKSIFPTDDSIRKIIYMSVKEISKKWTMPVRDWGLAYSQFAIFFEDRLAA